MNAGEIAASLRGEFESQRQAMIDLLGRLVRIESPSDDRAALDAFAAALDELFKAFGPIERIDPEDAERGRHLVVRVPGDSAEQHAVALCHYDTVWSSGTLEKTPFSVEQLLALLGLARKGITKLVDLQKMAVM